MIELFIKGCLVGLAVSVPIGPVGVLCVNRSIRSGARYGFATGLGAVAADLIFAMLAALGFVAVIRPYIDNNPWPAIFGGAFVIYLGISTFYHSRTKTDDNEKKDDSIIKSFLSTFLLMMSNPGAVLIFLVIFTAAGIDIKDAAGINSTLLFIGGVGTGAVFWWLFLSVSSRQLGKKINMELVRKINIIAGIVVAVFGILLILNAVNEYLL